MFCPMRMRNDCSLSKTSLFWENDLHKSAFKHKFTLKSLFRNFVPLINSHKGCFYLFILFIFTSYFQKKTNPLRKIFCISWIFGHTELVTLNFERQRKKKWNEENIKESLKIFENSQNMFVFYLAYSMNKFKFIPWI